MHEERPEAHRVLLRQPLINGGLQLSTCPTCPAISSATSHIAGCYTAGDNLNVVWSDLTAGLSVSNGGAPTYQVITSLPSTTTGSTLLSTTVAPHTFTASVSVPAGTTSSIDLMVRACVPETGTGMGQVCGDAVATQVPSCPATTCQYRSSGSANADVPVPAGMFSCAECAAGCVNDLTCAQFKWAGSTGTVDFGGQC